MVLTSCSPEPSHPEPGVSLQLAQARKAAVSNLEYDLRFTIPERRNSPIIASETIRFAFSGNFDLQLDFKADPTHLKKLSVNGSECAINLQNEHLLIPYQKLQSENEIKIHFIAGDLSLNRNDEYLYTLLVPDRARTVFPLMDQPDLKARWTLELDIPASWEAVANGPEKMTLVENGRKKIRFGQTKPISSYLFAFAAGKFQKITNVEGDMTMYYRESDTAKVQRNAPEIFSLHQTAINWLEDYTGIKYPFQKFDFALIPTFQYGGIEHPGAIFYRERSLMLDRSASINQQLRRASLISHETAHMWFGDLVTMKWFDDVWLKEVFANFMAAKMVNPSFPEIDHDLRFLLAHYPSAYAVDRSLGTHPIQQKLDNLQDAGSLYGSIIYQKAPIVMRNLEAVLGPEIFQEGMREYLDEYAYANATWDDLIYILSEKTHIDLDHWNQDWVKKAGMPEIKISPSDDSLSFEVTNVESNQTWPQQIQVLFDPGKIDFLLDQFQKIPLAGKEYFINSDGHAYAYFQLSENQISKIFSDWRDNDAIVRASGWIMLWESFLHHQIDPAKIFGELITAFSDENNPLILDYLSGRLQELFWNFLDQDEKSYFEKETEEMLFRGMLDNSDRSLQRIFYEVYTAIALSDSSTKVMHILFEDKLPGFNLSLSEHDKIRLALQLALREPESGQEIIEKQLEATHNSDNKDRLNFIAPALARLQEDRDHFFGSLLKQENREQEPWVSEALTYLNHPLRAEESIKYIQPSLEIIEEIKATGDIFFPKAWLDATLSGHHSKEAGEIVKNFLETHPELPVDLKNKILQSADILFRSQYLAN